VNGFDWIALISLITSGLRGYRNGLAGEFYRLFRMAVALLAGTGIYQVFGDLFSRIVPGDAGWTDPVLFIGTVVVVWKILHRLRDGMESLIRSKMPRHSQAIGGAVAATLKTAIIIGGIITVFHMASWLPGHETVAQSSFASRVLKPFLPAD